MFFDPPRKVGSAATVMSCPSSFGSGIAILQARGEAGQLDAKRVDEPRGPHGPDQEIGRWSRRALRSSAGRRRRRAKRTLRQLGPGLPQ